MRPSRLSGKLAAFVFACSTGLAPALAQDVALAPYKAVYDLSLLSSSGPNEIESARGRLVAEFSGNSCDGYVVNIRQLTILSSGDGEGRVIDAYSSTFEKGEGSSFRFRSATSAGRGPSKVVDGDADRKDKGLVIRVSKPKHTKAMVSDALFPTAHTRRLIEAARAGESTLSVRVFDGSDDGRKVYDTFAVIGKRIAPGADVEQPLKQAGLDKMAHWPVTISYFTPGSGERTPVYALAFDLYENGVNGSLRLDYDNFSLKGEIKKLEMKKPAKQDAACKG